MIPSIKSFYTERIIELAKLKNEDEAAFSERLELFVSLVAKDSDYANTVTNVTNELKIVTEQISSISQTIKNEVAKLYGDLPQSKMKNMLIDAATSMFLASGKNHVKETCKFMFIQLEILVEYLERKHSLLAWAEAENLKKTNGWEQYKIGTVTYGKFKGSKYLQPVSKPIVANDFFSQKEGGQIISDDTIKMIKEMRDYGSHGYHEDKVLEIRSTIGDVSANILLYLSKWLTFLTVLKSYL